MLLYIFTISMYLQCNLSFRPFAAHRLELLPGCTFSVLANNILYNLSFWASCDQLYCTVLFHDHNRTLGAATRARDNFSAQ